jgi:Zn-dependent protease
MANFWGDSTAKRMGLIQNPLLTVNWLGFLMFIMVGFGILGSVPVNHRAMRDPRRGALWTAFAGPLMNLFIAIIAAFLVRILVALGMGGANNLILLALQLAIFFNILLFVFNLMPFFPLDGWHIMLSLLPGYWLRREQVPAGIRTSAPPLSKFLQNPAYKWQDWAQLSQTLLLVMIFIGFVPGLPSPLGWLISGPVQALTRLIMGY